jgi:hypothetical protein
MAHHFAPCVAVAGLETLRECYRCHSRQCYTEALREHGAAFVGDPDNCAQCEAITDALREADAERSAIHSPDDPIPEYGPGDSHWSPIRDTQ